MKNYYKILEIPKDAAQLEIKKAYKFQAKKYHPDNSEDNKEYYEQKMIILNEAYEILSNEELKKDYDKKLKEYLDNNKNNNFTFRKINIFFKNRRGN